MHDALSFFVRSADPRETGNGAIINEVESHWHELYRGLRPDVSWDPVRAQVATETFLRDRTPTQCNCRKDVVDYFASHSIDYTSHASWFASIREFHNSVNARLGYELVSEQDARACWYNQAPCTQPRLVITIAIGRRFKEILRLTRPAIAAYAQRCGADFLALTNQQYDQWQREKFRVFDFAQQYDRTLFVDADVIIRESCPDLFQLYPDDDVVMHDDYGYITYPHDPAWAEPDHDAVMRSQGFSTKWNGKMWNSGLVLTSRRAAEIWKPPQRRLPSTEVSEQWWVQHQAEKFTVVDLPSELNWQWWFPSFGSRVDAAHVVHASGKCDKLATLRPFL